MIPTEKSPRFFVRRSKELLRLGLAAANMSARTLAECLCMDSDSAVEKWIDLSNDRPPPGWITSHPGCPPSVRATINAGYDATYSARAVPNLDLERESNVVTGIVGNLLAVISGAMADRRWSADEARMALPFATQLATHAQSFVAMLSERAGLDKQTTLAVVNGGTR